MPANKNALIRYKTIDQCLQNRARKWTLEDLVQKCSNALYEYEGRDIDISIRSIQSDIQMMRSDKLGYEAPIIVVNRKYYTYEDPTYSITKKALSQRDLSQLQQITDLLKQFKGFGYFDEMQTLVNKLEDKIIAEHRNEKPIIYFEKNDFLKGLEFLDVFHKIIINKKSVWMDYRTFQRNRKKSYVFYPWYLKEYRNRWYVFGVIKHNESKVVNLALDRIHSVSIAENEAYYKDETFDLEEYLSPVIGVTVPNVPFEKVVFKAHAVNAQYIITKPIHHSQSYKSIGDGVFQFELRVKINFELEKELLSFGEQIKILAPITLVESLKKRINETLSAY